MTKSKKTSQTCQNIDFEIEPKVTTLLDHCYAFVFFR